MSDYARFTTFSLEATLVSLRSSMIVHGATTGLRAIQTKIEDELARRKETDGD